MRDALFAKKLKPGDLLGTENEIAARYGVSRIVARDALRTLEALGIAEIKMGKGGGARVARGNPRLFAEALAVQLDLTGVSAAEIMDAQRAIECLAAELAAENATDADIARLRQLVADAEASIDDAARFTRAWRATSISRSPRPRTTACWWCSSSRCSTCRGRARNPTLTPKVARRILDVHKELLALIEIRDAAGARRLMDDHVKMIRARRRVAEHAQTEPKPTIRTATVDCWTCNGRRNDRKRTEETMAKEKFIIEPHFRLQEWVAEEKGYFKDEGLDYVFRETGAVERRRVAASSATRSARCRPSSSGRKSDITCACHWTVNVAASKGHGKLYGDVYSVSPCGIFVPPDSKVKTPEDLAGVPISVGYQSGSHYATIQALEQFMPQDKINLSFKDGLLFGRMEKLLDGKVPACTLFSGPYYFAEQLGFRKVRRLHLHDGDHDHRRSGHGGRAEVLPRAEAGAARHRSAAGALHALLQEGVPEALPRHDGYAPLGAGRAPRVRAVLARDLRRDSQLDRRARHLRRPGMGSRQVRRSGDLARRKRSRDAQRTSVRHAGCIELRRLLSDGRRAFRHPQPDVAVERGVVLQQIRASGRGARSRRAPAARRAR